MNRIATIRELAGSPRLSIYLRLALALMASSIIGGSLWPNIVADSGESNLYAQQAGAFLRGQADIPAGYHDAAMYKGRWYVPFPPVPALVLTPIVAAVGVAVTKASLVSIALSALNLAVLTRILRRLNVNARSIAWIVAAFFLGTGYWLCVAWSRGAWFFAHIVAVTCLLLAIDEALGRGRGALAGLALGLAVLSRQLTIYAAAFLLVALWENARLATRKDKMLNIAGFMAMLSLCGIAYLLFDWARFGNPFDTGYAYIELSGFLKDRVARYGLWSLAYVPFNFVSMFVQGFHLTFDPPMYLHNIQADMFGTSITFASPFVFVAFRARWNRRLLWAAWLSIGVSIAHALLYYNNGWFQPNTYRFALDFLPLLIVLVALGTQNVPQQVWKAAIGYSIALNCLALFCVPLANYLGF